MTHYLLLKTFLFNFYLLTTNLYFYLLVILLILAQTFLLTSLRMKFFLFLLLVLCFSVWGFIYNLDGMMLIMLTAEFTILLFFLMTYLQIYINFTFLTKTLKTNYLIILIACFVYSYPTLNVSSNYYNYYSSISHIVSSDFFILYFLLFNKLPILVIIVTIIISFFSLFFILLYFNLKVIKLLEKRTNKQLYFLRKQSLLKQTKFKTQIYTFQQ